MEKIIAKIAIVLFVASLFTGCSSVTSSETDSEIQNQHIQGSQDVRVEIQDIKNNG